MMNTYNISKLKLISLITLASVALIFSSEQISWAAFIRCPSNVNTCNGTAGDDIIFANSDNKNIQGLGGNDWI
jgi:hypothetical protein